MEENEYEQERRLAEWVRSDEWQFIRGKLLQYTEALESVNLLDDTLSNERVGEEAKVRSKAIRLVLSWIADVEGIEEQQRQPEDELEVDTIVVRR